MNKTLKTRVALGAFLIASAATTAVYAAGPKTAPALTPPAAPVAPVQVSLPGSAGWTVGMILRTLPPDMPADHKRLTAIRLLFDKPQQAIPPGGAATPETSCEGDPSTPVPWPRNGC